MSKNFGRALDRTPSERRPVHATPKLPPEILCAECNTRVASLKRNVRLPGRSVQAMRPGRVESEAAVAVLFPSAPTGVSAINSRLQARKYRSVRSCGANLARARYAS